MNRCFHVRAEPLLSSTPLRRRAGYDSDQADVTADSELTANHLQSATSGVVNPGHGDRTGVPYSVATYHPLLRPAAPMPDSQIRVPAGAVCERHSSRLNPEAQRRECAFFSDDQPPGLAGVIPVDRCAFQTSVVQPGVDCLPLVARASEGTPAPGVQPSLDLVVGPP